MQNCHMNTGVPENHPISSGAAPAQPRANGHLRGVWGGCDSCLASRWKHWWHLMDLFLASMIQHIGGILFNTRGMCSFRLVPLPKPQGTSNLVLWIET